MLARLALAGLITMNVIVIVAFNVAVYVVVVLSLGSLLVIMISYVAIFLYRDLNSDSDKYDELFMMICSEINTINSRLDEENRSGSGLDSRS